MSSSDIAISVRNLSKAYTIAHNAAKHTTLAEAMMHRLRHPLHRAERETFWALRDLSLEIKKGEVVGVIGRNGAGKSTFLKILSRITEPTSGKIDLYGRVGSLLEVGTGFHPELTGRENIYLNGQILGMRQRDIDRQFDAIVDFADVEKFLDTPVKRYSSGMYVRLAFAVAAHLDPEILVVDEVLAVGDLAFQKKCVGKMGEVARAGRTVIFVSHDMTTILRFCSSCVLLEAGRTRRAGATLDVVREYLESAAELAPVTDPGSATRKGWNEGNARLIEAELATEDRVGAWSIPFGMPLSFHVRFRLSRATDDVELGVGLFSLTGFEIASTVSTESIRTATLDAGEYEFTISYNDLRLATGRYRFGIGIRTHRGLEDYLPEAFYVDVVASLSSAEIGTHTMFGAVVPRVSYALAPTEAARDTPRAAHLLGH